MPLITKKFKIENAAEAYDALAESSTLSVLLEYSEKDNFNLQDSSVTIDTTIQNNDE